MTTDLDICFSQAFQENLNKHSPETDDEELKRYVKERICCAVKTLNSIGNTIKIEKIYLDVDCKYERIKIYFDESAPKYEIACLKVPPQIIILPSPPFFSPGNLIQTFDSLKNCCRRNPFSHRNLCHEFGHLQDAQRSGFDYEPPNKKLNPYVDVIWNILLESGFSKHGMALENKDKNLEYFRLKLKMLWIEPTIKDFERLWRKRNYNYEEIRELAQEYFSSSKKAKRIRG